MEPALTDTLRREKKMETEMALADSGLAVPIPRHRFTVDDFASLGEAGIFTGDDRVELIDGEIRDMTPIGQPHAVSRRCRATRVPAYPRHGWWTSPAAPSPCSRGPGPAGYADRRVLRRGEEIASTAVADLQLTVDEIVGQGDDHRR